MPNSKKDECPHEEWEYKTAMGDRWIAGNIESIHPDATIRWCPACGELWFREGDGPWFQRFWTAEDLAEAARQAEKFAEALGLKNDD